MFLKRGKYLSRNGRKNKFFKGKLGGGNSLGFPVGQSEKGEEVEIQKRIFTFVLYFGCFSFLLFTF